MRSVVAVLPVVASARMDVPLPATRCSLGSPGPVQFSEIAALLEVVLSLRQLVHELRTPGTHLPGHQGLLDDVLLHLQLLIQPEGLGRSAESGAGASVGLNDGRRRSGGWGIPPPNC